MFWTLLTRMFDVTYRVVRAIVARQRRAVSDLAVAVPYLDRAGVAFQIVLRPPDCGPHRRGCRP